MLETKEYRRLSLTRNGGVLIVTLNSGHKANAFCLESMQELNDVANTVAEDMDVSAVILTGQSQIFSGGMNLSDSSVLEPAGRNLQELRRGAALGAKMCRAWESIEALTIAAIEGGCVGAGVALSLALDLRVCAENSLLYVPEIERGMNMSWQSVPRSVSLIGPAKTKRMFMLAEKVTAAQALDWGWADYLSASGTTVDQALQLAKQMEKLPPISVRMCKQSINVAANALNHAVSYMDADQLVLTQHSEDYREGIDSFLEKREPSYRGC
ncbi:enoyl-CoA hydratase/isomerase family protein [Pseudomaricurvus alkylphenolicus]|uniref:enoyl-CoA hydratase/isomerase family protein n=1 Tax=Pseudomaricurvus alkylphenolicus TaxID=1306991 RepID=UPI001420744F|nr:enoyl-CoA hydratase/isomerase family protein [Pseudomaricurvus alkylphenolicus]NIB41066.1 enoyl-CoA hydratase/isomerase family protein [Pseudomaricurvus alkylphenolicus]